MYYILCMGERYCYVFAYCIVSICELVSGLDIDLKCKIDYDFFFRITTFNFKIEEKEV